MSATAIDARLREASRLAGSLRPQDRLPTKIDPSGRAIATRFKEASELLELCRALARAGASATRPVSKSIDAGS
jgi:hypothetical protein